MILYLNSCLKIDPKLYQLYLVGIHLSIAEWLLSFHLENVHRVVMLQQLSMSLKTWVIKKRPGQPTRPYPVVLYHHFVCIDFSYIKPTDIIVHTFYLDEKHSATENPVSHLAKFEKIKK